MIVYVESNFVLEMALEQEQASYCNQIISICEKREAKLVIPAFCLAEPFETLGRRANERRRLHESLSRELSLLARTSAYQQDLAAAQSLTDLLIRSGEEEIKRLQATFERILNVAEIIPLDRTILASAGQHQLDYGLRVQDAIIFSSILHHLSSTVSHQKCFLNRNSKDFDDPAVELVLTRFQCKMLYRFDFGLNYIKSQIPQ